MESWRNSQINGRRRREVSYSFLNGTAYSRQQVQIFTSLALWNHVGDGIFANSTEGGIRIISYPDLRIIGRTGAHVRGLYAAALDPRGKYVCIWKPLPDNFNIVQISHHRWSRVDHQFFRFK